MPKNVLIVAFSAFQNPSAPSTSGKVLVRFYFVVKCALQITGLVKCHADIDDSLRPGRHDLEVGPALVHPNLEASSFQDFLQVLKDFAVTGSSFRHPDAHGAAAPAFLHRRVAPLVANQRQRALAGTM